MNFRANNKSLCIQFYTWNNGSNGAKVSIFDNTNGWSRKWDLS